MLSPHHCTGMRRNVLQLQTIIGDHNGLLLCDVLYWCFLHIEDTILNHWLVFHMIHCECLCFLFWVPHAMTCKVYRPRIHRIPLDRDSNTRLIDWEACDQIIRPLYLQSFAKYIYRTLFLLFVYFLRHKTWWSFTYLKIPADMYMCSGPDLQYKYRHCYTDYCCTR